MADFLDDTPTANLRDQLEDKIRSQILEGRFKKQARLPSVRELAATYSVSLGTVANALARLKKQGLLQTRKKKGIFLSTGAGKREAHRKTGNIGVVVQGVGDALRDSNHFAAFNGVRNFAAERGYKVLYLGTRQTFSEASEPELPFGIRDVDGVIYMISDTPAQPFMRAVQKLNLPIVMTDWFDSALKTDGVLIDNFAASLAMMRHLLDFGHQRIAFINSPIGPTSEERFEGYRKTLEENGIPFDPRLVRISTSDMPSGQAAMSDLLPLNPTAVFAFNDYLARGAIQAVQARGLAVPEDISVAGFGKQSAAPNQAGQKLTTVEFNMEQMGATSAQLLFRRIDGYQGSPELGRVPAKIIPGDTTAKCNVRRALKRKA